MKYSPKPERAYLKKTYVTEKCMCGHCVAACPERAEEKRRMLEAAKRALRGKTV